MFTVKTRSPEAGMDSQRQAAGDDAGTRRAGPPRPQQGAALRRHPRRRPGRGRLPGRPRPPRTGQVTALAPGLPADLQPRHRLRPLIEVTRQPRPGTGSPRRSPGDTVRLTHPNLVHAGNAGKRYGHAAAAALPGQWRHVEEAAKWPDAHACRSTGSARITSALAMTQRPCRTADLAPRYLNGDHLA